MANINIDVMAAIPSPMDERDWIAESIYPESNELKLPKTLDLRKDLQEIKNQGRYPTCAAHVAACLKEYQEKKDVNIDDIFSHWFVYNNRKNYPNSGMYGRNVMEILQKSGCCLKSTYDTKNQHKTTPESYKDAMNYKIKSYATVTTIEGLKKALYLNGPCYISFPVYDSSKTFYKPKDKNDIRRGGHAITVVGYDKDGFILRNSWGKQWGDNGYTNYSYSDFGCHWEIWTTIDEKSVKPIEPKPRPNPICSCFK